VSGVKYEVLDSTGKKVEQINLDPHIFDAQPIQSLVHETVVWQLAKRRAGTHKALTRTEMVASKKKPYKQKGTGRARAGSFISPLWVGGAVVHGPRPRSYETRVAKRARGQALCAVLSDKVRHNNLIVLDQLKFKEGKTREFSALLAKLKVTRGGVVVLLAGEKDDNLVIRSSRNLKAALPISVSGLNVFDLLRNKYLLCTREGVSRLEKRLAKLAQS
jgi:large subunit ribosomal protein L4